MVSVTQKRLGLYWIRVQQIYSNYFIGKNSERTLCGTVYTGVARFSRNPIDDATDSSQLSHTVASVAHLLQWIIYPRISLR